MFELIYGDVSQYALLDEMTDFGYPHSLGIWKQEFSMNSSRLMHIKWKLHWDFLWLSQVLSGRREGIQYKKNEGQRRKEAEMKERRCLVPWYWTMSSREYCIEEIEEATDILASDRKIGKDWYRPGYKGTLDHAHVAIKVLRSDDAQEKKQFQHEVKVLNFIRHHDMVLLLRACP